MLVNQTAVTQQWLRSPWATVTSERCCWRNRNVCVRGVWLVKPSSFFRPVPLMEGSFHQGKDLLFSTFSTFHFADFTFSFWLVPFSASRSLQGSYSYSKCFLKSEFVALCHVSFSHLSLTSSTTGSLIWAAIYLGSLLFSTFFHGTFATFLWMCAFKQSHHDLLMSPGVLVCSIWACLCYLFWKLRAYSTMLVLARPTLPDPPGSSLSLKYNRISLRQCLILHSHTVSLMM